MMDMETQRHDHPATRRRRPGAGIFANERLLFGLACTFAGFLLGHLGRDSPSQVELYRRQLAAPRLNAAARKQLEAEADSPPVREVRVGSMCRCPSGALPVPGPMAVDGHDTEVLQHPSKATGSSAKHFVMHPGGCQCLENHPNAEWTNDDTLSTLQQRCPAHVIEGNGLTPRYGWEALPDFGVEERLPLFIGALSYESPLSLNSSLHNWRDHRLFERSGAQDVFVQLNHRSELDSRVLDEYNDLLVNEDGRPPVTVMGTPEENLHPGLAISRMCRAAEAHPNSHPNGENLLMFLEKDWHFRSQVRNPEQIFASVNSLAQRGVNYIRLQGTVSARKNIDRKTWQCPARGVPWTCSTAHHHRWTNLPMVLSCKWFLRYLEPFALLDDPIMYGCRPGFMHAGYSDWEEALMDGRVAWTDSQWTVAHVADPFDKLFKHHEVDQ